MTKASRCIAASALALGLQACGDQRAAVIRVEVSTDLADVRWLELRTISQDGARVLTRGQTAWSRDVTHTFNVVPRGDDLAANPDAVFEVAAGSCDPEGGRIPERCVLLTRRVRVRYLPGLVRGLRLRLEGACRGVRCAAPLTCAAGACVSERVYGGDDDAASGPDAAMDATDETTDVAVAGPDADVLDAAREDAVVVGPDAAVVDAPRADAPADVALDVPVDVCVRRPENTTSACADGVDNDCDGFIDCRDFECASVAACVVDAGPRDSATDGTSTCSSARPVDLLFVIDNSNSMSENQAGLARNFDALLDPLVNPPLERDPLSGVMRPAWQAARSLHVGVVSADLGTPGSAVPSCANSDVGDDGLLNPIRSGQAIRSHQPWTTAPAGRRPARCTNDPNQYPTFLRYDAGLTSQAVFREDFVCNAYLSIGGCGLEQQIESAYRALVVRNPRALAGNTDPNTGFVRDGAVLGVFFVTDEEDGSTRDCRYAQPGVPCSDAVSVFEPTSGAWSSRDLNLRFYLYTPGSPQDPTWPLDRYIDVRNLTRGFLTLKPGRPDLIAFGALTGVPLRTPQTIAGTVDWTALLGNNPDGSDGLVAMSVEGPISMRQNNPDPMCSTRVVPACRREGSTMATACDPAAQYFAWPSRRVAELIRRAEATTGGATLGSICALDYSATMRSFARQVGTRVCR